MFFWGLLNTGQIRPKEALRGRCNSFVVETHVHFPTDINLLLDDMRKSITLSAQWCQELGLSDWHQWAYNLRQVKQPMRSAENQKHSKARSPEQLEKNQALIVKARQAHMKVAQTTSKKSPKHWPSNWLWVNGSTQTGLAGVDSHWQGDQSG